MIRYTIKLSKQEVEELEAIVNKGSHKSQTYRAAYILQSSFSIRILTAADNIFFVLKDFSSCFIVYILW